MAFIMNRALFYVHGDNVETAKEAVQTLAAAAGPTVAGAVKEL